MGFCGKAVCDHRSRSAAHGSVPRDSEGGRVKAVRLPAMSPNLNAYAERFVKTIECECLKQFVIFGERHLRYLIKEFMKHYHTERFHRDSAAS